MVVGNADGTGDGVMLTRDVQELASTYCQEGVPVQFTVDDRMDHDVTGVLFEPAALAFIDERYLGLTVPDGCPSIGPGNALTPLAIPETKPVAPPLPRPAGRPRRKSPRKVRSRTGRRR
jgi:hypothetical protein